MKVENKNFGNLKDGTEVRLFTIKNEDGSQLQLTNYGAAVVSLQVPDRNGINEHVVLGFDDLQKYEQIRSFYGATVGRFGNRIAKGKFRLNGKVYTLAVNEGNNHLHGGIKGFDRVMWHYYISDGKAPGVMFSYLSKEGEEGYPGNFNVTVCYSFTEDHKLIIDYVMKSDQPTIKNVTNHSYFNLSGNVKESILNHSIKINSYKYLPIDDELIPTGEVKNVKDSVLDFTSSYTIGERIHFDEVQLKNGLGYDHCWILNKENDDLDFAAEVYEPRSGRVMNVYTTEPAIQFYSGNFIDGSHAGREGIAYGYRYGICLETQHYPDSPNHLDFPSTIILPGEIYKSKTVYEFLVR